MTSGLIARYKCPVWVIVPRVIDGCVVDLDFGAREAYGTVWLVALSLGKTLETLCFLTYGTFELYDLLSCTLHAANGLGDSAMVLDVVPCVSKLFVGELRRDQILIAAAALELWRKSNTADTDPRLVTSAFGHAEKA